MTSASRHTGSIANLKVTGIRFPKSVLAWTSRSQSPSTPAHEEKEDIEEVVAAEELEPPVEVDHDSPRSVVPLSPPLAHHDGQPKGRQSSVDEPEEGTDLDLMEVDEEPLSPRQQRHASVNMGEKAEEDGDTAQQEHHSRHTSVLKSETRSSPVSVRDDDEEADELDIISLTSSPSSRTSPVMPTYPESLEQDVPEH